MKWYFRMYVDETANTRYGIEIEADSKEDALRILQEVEDGDRYDLDWIWEQQDVPEEGDRSYFLVQQGEDRSREVPIDLSTAHS